MRRTECSHCFKSRLTVVQLEKALPHGCQPRRESLCDSLAWVGLLSSWKKTLLHGCQPRKELRSNSFAWVGAVVQLENAIATWMSTSQRNAAKSRVSPKHCKLDAASPRIARQFLRTLRMGGTVVRLEKTLPHWWIFRGIADIIKKKRSQEYGWSSSLR